MTLKSKLSLLFIGVFAILFLSPLEPYAYEVWHTVSGKSYNVYSYFPVRVNAPKDKQKRPRGEPPRGAPPQLFFLLSYQTQAPLTNDPRVDEKSVMTEANDLWMHLYLFKLPEKIKKNKNALIGIHAFKDLPKTFSDNPSSKRFEKKISEIMTLLKNHPPDPHRLKAFQTFNARKFSEAISSFKKIKLKVPHDYTQGANAYLLLRKKGEAVQWLKKALKLYPKDVTLLNNLAMATLLTGTYFSEKKYEYDPKQMIEAKKILNRALEVDSENWLTKANMAVLETTLKRYDAAEKLYAEALKLSDQDPELSRQVAIFYHEQKKYDQAKIYYQRTLKELRTIRSPAAEAKIKAIEKFIKLADLKKPPF